MKSDISRGEIISTLKQRGFVFLPEGTQAKAESFRLDDLNELVYVKTGASFPLVIDPRHENQHLMLAELHGVSGGEGYSHSTAYGRFPLRQHTGYKPVNYGLDFGFASVTALDNFLDVLLASRASAPDTEAVRFVAGFMSPENPQLANWRPKYEVAVTTVRDALANHAAHSVFELIWRTRDNSVSNAGQGVMGFDTADRLRERLVGVIEDVAADGSPANFESIVQQFEAWRIAGELPSVPRLLIARAFSAIHPERYHTTVDASKQDRVIPWFARHTGFVPPEGGWATKAEALTAHLASWKGFGGDSLLRNMFPWFVFDQLRDAAGHVSFRPGHVERPQRGLADVSPGARDISYRHNVLQGHLYKLLCAEYGQDAVRTEHPTGTGGFADAVVRRGDAEFDLYEIKVAATAADAVRQATGQLLEYAYRRGGLEPRRLCVVAEPSLDEITSEFLTRLNSEFGLRLEYLQLDFVDPLGV